MTSALFLVNTASLPSNLVTGSHLTLSPEIFRHAVKSMRLNDGDELMLSDGQGLRVTSVLSDAENGVVTISSIEREPAPKVRLRLIQALAKGGRDEMAIEESTEIGVDEVVPWQADRSIVQWNGSKAAKAARKWDALLTAASEQSRRAWKPVLADVVSTKQLVRLCEQETARGNLMVVLHQDATQTWEGIEQRCVHLAVEARGAAVPPVISFVVGPEGGVSDREIGLLTAAGAESVVIGCNILRASTAGPVAVTLLSRVLGRF
ncbi:MAG: 16S rRNA (uracil(1498)-N(3))-methyltransferase [Bifidobacteriaceae bacterium]|jgi:16S rRNA (uracil1498-N3)-methyltransferase|nr:16S rRNA (uracil(1498)-N(3))-methyltransferase [Bifidobacteriaceae bacterium]MCI1914130.1 16S rRNA (uracil(1498)-N(3))-methyltransferase [Bifidobacteriaceae bacterium]MCI1936385.1 16S rRNA (uracil(1498)-N(3))-methyltransferase [Bifidobacteriaceae bacterium]